MSNKVQSTSTVRWCDVAQTKPQSIKWFIPHMPQQLANNYSFSFIMEQNYILKEEKSSKINVIFVQCKKKKKIKTFLWILKYNLFLTQH